MKKLIIICAIAATAINANAQASGQSRWDDNPAPSNSHGVVRQDNEFANTEISQDEKVITFSDLPKLMKPILAVVTTSTGEPLTQKRINPTNNTLNLHGYPRGEMYFVTLVYRGKSQKAFVVHL